MDALILFLGQAITLRQTASTAIAKYSSNLSTNQLMNWWIFHKTPKDYMASFKMGQKRINEKEKSDFQHFSYPPVKVFPTKNISHGPWNPAICVAETR